MDAFLRLSMGDRRLACLQVEDRKRLQAVSVEKDFWVCWTLRELFSLPKASGWMTFKGGTSLSKAWGLIDRFSEDIDIVVGKDLLGFAGDASPDRASSNKQRKRRLDELMAACRTWMQNALKPALAESITKRLGDSDVDYTTLRVGSLRLVPPAHHRADWQRDYEQMAESMFYGDRPDFEEILRVVGDFQQRFNSIAALPPS